MVCAWHVPCCCSSFPCVHEQQGWSTALGPWKAMPMNLLMMFMMGNSIGLFPIMMLGMMVYRPVQALLSYREGDSGCLYAYLAQDGTKCCGMHAMCSPALKELLNHCCHLVTCTAFQRSSGDQGLLQRVVYVSANIVVLALATWKLRSMGLLPTAQSDWVEFIEARQVLTNWHRHMHA